MRCHRDRRATPHCAKSRPPPEAVARRVPLVGVACLRVASATRRRCTSSQRHSPDDPGASK